MGSRDTSSQIGRGLRALPDKWPLDFRQANHTHADLVEPRADIVADFVEQEVVSFMKSICF